MSDRSKPAVVIGPRQRDGTVRLEGRDWHMDYRQGDGDPSPHEMALKVEWLVMCHAQARMERAAQETRERARRRNKERHDDLVDALLDAISRERHTEVPY